LKNEQKLEKYRREILSRINRMDGKIDQQKAANKREIYERMIEDAIKQDDIEDNIRKKENQDTFKRMKKLTEMEEKDKTIASIQQQKLKIFEERKKMNKELEKNKEELINRFNAIMKKKGNKTKEEIFQMLFNESPETIESKYLSTNAKNKSKFTEEDKRNESSKQKEDNVFLTNVRISKDEKKEEKVKKVEKNEKEEEEKNKEKKKLGNSKIIQEEIRKDILEEDDSPDRIERVPNSKKKDELDEYNDFV
jgi:centrosomal protein CEP76